MGIPEYEAKRYEGLVKDGGILVSVHCDDADLVNLAKDILLNAGGEGIASSSESSKVVKGTEPTKQSLQNFENEGGVSESSTF